MYRPSTPIFRNFALSTSQAFKGAGRLRNQAAALSMHLISIREASLRQEESRAASRRFHGVLQRARKMAEESHVKLMTHVLAGHPARDVVKLATDLEVELLVIGATGHSAIYERMIGSRADRIVQLAQCPVLVVK